MVFLRRESGYGMACFYKKDYERIGGFGKWTKVSSWGGEDVYLISKFQSKMIEAFRAVTPSLFHLYHGKECDRTKMTWTMYKSCIKVKIRNEGTQFNLGLNLFNYTNVLDDKKNGI